MNFFYAAWHNRKGQSQETSVLVLALPPKLGHLDEPFNLPGLVYVTDKKTGLGGLV